jgi:hypothetical protein
MRGFFAPTTAIIARTNCTNITPEPSPQAISQRTGRADFSCKAGGSPFNSSFVLDGTAPFGGWPGVERINNCEHGIVERVSLLHFPRKY